MFVRSRSNFQQNLSAAYQWKFGTSWDSFCQPLITFCLFAVISVLFRLLCYSSLLLMLPLLCVFGVGGGQVWPQSDDNASHVIAASPISRCVRGQTVVQQLSKEHAELQKHAKCFQEATNVGKLDTIHFL